MYTNSKLQPMRYQDSDSKQRYETSQAYITAMSNVDLQLNSQSILVQTEIQKPLLNIAADL